MTIMMSQTLDTLYVNSVSVINMLQTRYPGQEDLMVWISKIGDPRYAFTLYFPLIFAFNQAVGKRLLLVAIVAEWMNQILKWVLHGDRPYWWIHETSAYNKTGETPTLQQFYVTCETGPGCPSGHAMAMSAIWFTMISAFIANVLRPSQPLSFGKGIVEKLLWWSYTCFILAIILSRVYLATHFPHQCLIGAVIGYYLAYTMDKIKLDYLKLRHYLLATVFVTSTALSTYVILRALGSDPLWSVNRALKWCIKREYVHLDTSPFFSMVRYCGAILGLGLGVTSQWNESSSRLRYTKFGYILAAVLSVLSATLVDELGSLVSKERLDLFYPYAFFLHALLPFLVTAVVPFVVSSVAAQPEKHKLK